MIREVIKNLPYDGLHCLNIEVKIRKEPYIFCLKLVHLHCSFSQCAEDIYWHYICYMIAFLTLGYKIQFIKALSATIAIQFLSKSLRMNSRLM